MLRCTPRRISVPFAVICWARLGGAFDGGPGGGAGSVRIARVRLANGVVEFPVEPTA